MFGGIIMTTPTEDKNSPNYKCPNCGIPKKHWVDNSPTETPALDEIQKQVWGATILNKDNPLGYRVLDAHFSQLLLKQKVQEVLEPELDLDAQNIANARNSKDQRLLGAIKRDDLRAEIRKELGLE